MQISSISARLLLSRKEGRSIEAPRSQELYMPRNKDCGHSRDYPCTCAMGNLYRFVEPVVLLLLKRKGKSYGYDLGNELHEYALTDAAIERAALYRTLRALEINGNVVSEWETDRNGPARRVYRLTRHGEAHLQEWADVLDHVAKSMSRFVKLTRGLAGGSRKVRTKSA